MTEKKKRGRPMGVRHQDDVRAKIQAGQLIKILTEHAVGVTEEISASRMKAIEILLKKSLPDLTAVTIGGDSENPIAIGAVLIPVKA